MLIILIAGIEAGGHGLIVPTLPSMLRKLTSSENVDWYYGFFSSVYMGTQCICASFIGLLSDRFGRRSMLLGSLTVSALCYLFTACYPSLIVLFLANLMTGAIGTTFTISSLIIIDISDYNSQARRIGFVGAAAGIGFVAGPGLGGLLGVPSPRIPYFVAAALCAVGALMVGFLLSETRALTHTNRKSAVLFRTFLFSPLRSCDAHLVAIFIVLVVAAQIPGSLFVLYGESRFGWSGSVVGLFVACFGLLQAAAQLFLVGPMVGYFGERRCIVLGCSIEACGYMALSFASESWQAFALLSFWCFGGIVGPCLQVALSRTVAFEEQAKLPGTLTSVASLISVPGPFIAADILRNTPSTLPGLVWIITAAAYGIIPILMTLHKFKSRRILARP